MKVGEHLPSLRDLMVVGHADHGLASVAKGCRRFATM